MLTNSILWVLMAMKLGVNPNFKTRIVSRTEWGARPPLKPVQHIMGDDNYPLKYVIIHHSYIPEACYNNNNCEAAMRKMQDMHQLTNEWNDIGYSFGIGGDGLIYAGRGFGIVGAHAPKYNDKSVGICLIGDWRTELPSEKMLDATKLLIQFGLENGIIHQNYTILGHRQVRDTECPGDRLFAEISSWPHFSATVPPLN